MHSLFYPHFFTCVSLIEYYLAASMDQRNFMMKFLQRSTLKRKREECEFYEDLELFFPKSSNEEEETAGIVSCGLLEFIGDKERKYHKQDVLFMWNLDQKLSLLWLLSCINNMFM